jgi:dTDP-4-dehydrorhamnose reductase
MKKRLLVTGPGGFVAGSVIDQARQHMEVHGAGRSSPEDKAGQVRYHQLDVLNKSQWTALFNEIRPDGVIHAAAISDINYCQNNRDVAEKVNTEYTRILVDLCAASGAKMVFCSTDNVFDGAKGLYTEEDTPDPVNFYGETKLKSEQIVAGLGERGVIARLALVMGLPVMGRGNSFLATMTDKLKAGETMNFATNEIRSPIDVITLGRTLIELAENNFSGIIHLGGNSRLTRFDMARQITERLGFSPELINAVDSSVFKNRAPRPQDVSMANDRAKQVLKTPMLSLAEGLDLVMKYKKWIVK